MQKFREEFEYSETDSSSDDVNNEEIAAIRKELNLDRKPKGKKCLFNVLLAHLS